jgi:hypothetical protein
LCRQGITHDTQSIVFPKNISLCNAILLESFTSLYASTPTSEACTPQMDFSTLISLSCTKTLSVVSCAQIFSVQKINERIKNFFFINYFFLSLKKNLKFQKNSSTACLFLKGNGAEKN